MNRTVILKIERLFPERDRLENILELMFLRPTSEFSLTEIASQGGVSKSTASRLVRELEGKQMVQVVDLGVVWRVRANLQNPHYVREKILHNLALVYRSGLADLLSSLFPQSRSLVLFGKYRRGEDEPGSQIDIGIGIEGAGKVRRMELKETEGVPDEQRASLSAWEKQIQRSVVITVFDSGNPGREVLREIANGIVLKGELEVGKDSLLSDNKGYL